MTERVMCRDLRSRIGDEVTVKGWAHRVRALGRVTFILLRDRTGLVQVVAGGPLAKESNVAAESVLEVRGLVKQAPKVESGIEIEAGSLRVVSSPTVPLPFEINLADIGAGLESQLDHRVLSLRNPKVRAAFTVQSEIALGFKEFLSDEGFTEVHTAKIVATGTEGGADLFPVRYFETPAFLAQSPQFYKQMLVGAGFERVFEVGPVFRAEKHNTSRHLNEFTSLDLEVGFIDGLHDLLALEERLLSHIFGRLRAKCAAELDMYGVQVPEQGSIPRLQLSEISGILEREFGKRLVDGNLDAEGERLICLHVMNETGSPLVFATHYPRSSRPMYTLPDQDNPSVTQSFDLLFRGMEMNSGGMRISDHAQLTANMVAFGLNPQDFQAYLEVFRHGMPPHGGFAIGLERLTAKVLGLENIRYATLFPRDRDRLAP